MPHVSGMRWHPKSFSDLLNPPQLVWPAKGNRLLKPCDDWDQAVTFSPHGFDREVHIWTGYMRAGDALIDEAGKRGVDRHFLIYPILFNYRHGLELALKWTIGQYGPYVGIYLGRDDANHNLWSLWKQCKKVLNDLGGEGISEDGVVGVECIVKDFHDLDKIGVAFRYSRDKNGVTIELPKTTIDLANIQQVMEGVDNFFSGADGLLDSYAGAADYPESDW